MLDKAWGLEPESRLSCQAIVTNEDLIILNILLIMPESINHYA